MRFLIVTKSSTPPPMEIAGALIQAMEAWLDRHSAKMGDVWGFAGLQGGGGILDVESPDELDEIMQQFPFAPFSETEIYALVDVRASLRRSMQAIEAMTPPR